MIIFGGSFFPVTDYNGRRYLVSASGIKCKEKVFAHKRDAKNYMYKICKKYCITVDCVERYEGGKMYSNHKGVEFCINEI